ncbi:hypothetical protein WA026_014553 [Henosepilachna vigintioctopunctata]|uniref:Protein cueball n=1 Tax=Henosepilachna vigintioctopunctata TaxID=420089 RepID=A0AAW1V6I1_9CUCU
MNHTINYISLKGENQRRQILFIFEDARPQDIAVHICNRYIYWTNSNTKRPTIERARIGSQQREIIVESDLGMPAGITIDYVTQRIYWADIREGIFYRLESTNLVGQERQIEFEGIHTEPFAVAVKNEYLYFTDLRRNSLWKYDLAKNSPPLEIRNFEEKPMGLIAKKENIKTLPDCKILQEAYHNYTKPVIEKFQKIEVKNSSKKLECINGTLQDGLCRCTRGFTGKFCEISLCHNYCFSGTCHLTNQGYPYCHCPKGSGGTRCERDCDGYCLNDGDCRFSFPNARLPTCVCQEGFRGLRCEGSVITDKLCDVYCSQESRLEHNNDPEYTYCKCSRRSYVNVMDNQSPQALLSTSNSSNFVNYFQDPVFITMICITFTVLAMCLFLTIYILHLRRKPMPRIKRRYIVNNKNSTSMTERPQHPEQCEITIENCCNMNVCETPCFEPSKLQSYHQSRSDDKKMLLPNMERTEDMY